MDTGKILIIEDKPDNREILTMHLMLTKHEILEAHDGEKALKILRSGNNSFEIGLIFCDIQMPKMNGLKTLKILTREYPLIPLVIITGYPDMELKALAKERGAKDYLLKPVEKNKLLQTVDKYYEVKKELESCVKN